MADRPARENLASPPSTRTLLLGGRILVARQALGLIFALSSTLLITRLIGPGAYGIYASVFGIVFLLQYIFEFSLDVYIVRHPAQMEGHTPHVVFTLLLGLAILGVAVGLALIPFLASLTALSGFTPVALAMVPSLFVMHMQQVPLSQLERRLNYGPIGAVEVGGQALFALTGVSLALAGFGVWAPVLAWWAQQVVLMLGFFWGARYRPRLWWDSAIVRRAMMYGVISTPAGALATSKALVNSILVARFLGAESVAFVALAVRILEQLMFLKSVSLRIGLRMLSLLSNDAVAMQRGLSRGTFIQILAAATPVLVFLPSANSIILLLFGPQWRLSAEMVILMAPAYVLSALYQIPVAALSARDRPWSILVAQGLHSLILASTSLLLLPLLGLRGYAAAEFAALTSFLVIAWAVRRNFGRVNYRPAFTILALVVVVAAAVAVNTWFFLLMVPLLALPYMWGGFRDLLAVWKRGRLVAEPPPIM